MKKLSCLLLIVLVSCGTPTPAALKIVNGNWLVNSAFFGTNTSLPAHLSMDGEDTFVISIFNQSRTQTVCLGKGNTKTGSVGCFNATESIVLTGGFKNSITWTGTGKYTGPSGTKTSAVNMHLNP